MATIRPIPNDSLAAYLRCAGAKHLGLAHTLTEVPIDGLAECFRCREAAQLSRVAVDFAANSRLKDKVNSEARQLEKRRDEEEVEKFLAGLEKDMQMAQHPNCSQWGERLFPFHGTREKIKDKPIDEAEAYLKEVEKQMEHIFLHTPPTTSPGCWQWHPPTPN